VNAFQHISAYFRFVNEYRRFKALATADLRFPVQWKNRNAFLKEKTARSGFDRHYIYHTAWAARMVRQANPAFHVDISSSLYFSSIVSAFVPVRFYEFRPPDLVLSNLSTDSADLLALPFESISVASLSCMHVVEHAGLGRYGDPLNPSADLAAIAELKRVLAPAGSLLFVVPLGKPLVRFNSHRIYSYGQIVDYFKGLTLAHYAFIPEFFSDGPMVEDPPRETRDCGLEGCGCFMFTK
jgi:SAM-dependent methyltransferase